MAPAAACGSRDNAGCRAGVSFLPFDTGSYQQTPYETVDEAVHAELAQRMPSHIDWGRFQDVERGWRDFKVGQELACSSSGCENVGELVGDDAEAAGEQRAAASGTG